MVFSFLNLKTPPSTAYEPLSKQKAPKVLADATTWMKDALTEFGIAGLSLRPLIEHLKTALKNSNAAVRTSGTNCLVTLKIFAGGGTPLSIIGHYVAHVDSSHQGFSRRP
jgi:hypothetical protein